MKNNRFTPSEMNQDDFRFLNLLILKKYLEIITEDTQVIKNDETILYSIGYIDEKSHGIIGHTLLLDEILDKVYVKELGSYKIKETFVVIREILKALDLGWSDISSKNNLRQEKDERDYNTSLVHEIYVVQSLHYSRSPEVEGDFFEYTNKSSLKKYIRNLKIEEIL